MKKKLMKTICLLIIAFPALGLAQTTGEGPNLVPRIKQQDIRDHTLTLPQIRDAGLRIFSTPFNRHDGYGDGKFNPYVGTPLAPGNRPTLQYNGLSLRVNGLDAQTCLECHFIVRNSTIPATMGIGGVGGIAAQVTFMPSEIDTLTGKFNGRYINPPFIFGTGGVELVAKEMTIHLQKIKKKAKKNPRKWFRLTAKGVNFGWIRYKDGTFDTSWVRGIDKDCVVRPFIRKGEASTVRDFELGAMQFHFGMQPDELFPGEDGDEDGVTHEILEGEISAVHIWATTLNSPIIKKPVNKQGFDLFKQIGCAECHRPAFVTKNKMLTYSSPEVDIDPMANIYYKVDLAKETNFRQVGKGILVPLFSDFKRHYMGKKLAENFHDVPDGSYINYVFITAKLWGLHDTAPYLHDGRATTITDAIVLHGGEAFWPRYQFMKLAQNDKEDLLEFLYSLRTPLDSEKVILEDDLFLIGE